MNIEYSLKRSNRKSISLSVGDDGSIKVRAPMFMTRTEIDAFVQKHSGWIANRREKISRKAAISPQTEKRLRAEAQRLLPELTKKFGAAMGVSPTYVKITGAKSRFGSCNAQNGICYSWRLMLYPMDAVEYVVVHELAHIRHKNHSVDFYAEVARVFPDHKRRRALLRQ